jgi:hypothetical protein
MTTSVDPCNTQINHNSIHSGIVANRLLEITGTTNIIADDQATQKGKICYLTSVLFSTLVIYGIGGYVS